MALNDSELEQMNTEDVTPDVDVIDNEKLYTSGEIADIIKTSPAMVQKRCREYADFLHPLKTSGGQNRYTEDDVHMLQIIFSLAQTKKPAEVRKIIQDEHMRDMLQPTRNSNLPAEYVADMAVLFKELELNLVQSINLSNQEAEERVKRLYGSIGERNEQLEQQNTELKQSIEVLSQRVETLSKKLEDTSQRKGFLHFFKK